MSTFIKFGLGAIAAAGAYVAVEHIVKVRRRNRLARAVKQAEHIIANPGECTAEQIQGVVGEIVSALPVHEFMADALKEFKAAAKAGF